MSHLRPNEFCHGITSVNKRNRSSLLRVCLEILPKFDLRIGIFVILKKSKKNSIFQDQNLCGDAENCLSKDIHAHDISFMAYMTVTSPTAFKFCLLMFFRYFTSWLLSLIESDPDSREVLMKNIPAPPANFLQLVISRATKSCVKCRVSAKKNFRRERKISFSYRTSEILLSS
jgi:hypothetical protein